MPLDLTEVEIRKSSLSAKLGNDQRRYLKLGRLNYYAALGIRWLAAAAGLIAGVLGLTNQISSSVIGGIAAFSGLLLAFGRDLKFQQKANWHYRKSEGAGRFHDQLAFGLPERPSVENVAAVAADYARFEEEMTARWENNVAADDAPSPPPST